MFLDNVEQQKKAKKLHPACWLLDVLDHLEMKADAVESLSPFVYWGQSNDTVFLKVALSDTKVSLSDTTGCCAY